VRTPPTRRPRRRFAGGVLVWGLGLTAASLGAALLLLTVTQRSLGIFAWSGGSGDFPWVGAAVVLAALPVVAVIFAIWARVALRTSH